MRVRALNGTVMLPAVAATSSEALLRERDDRAPFRRLVGE